LLPSVFGVSIVHAPVALLDPDDARGRIEVLDHQAGGTPPVELGDPVQIGITQVKET